MFICILACIYVFWVLPSGIGINSFIPPKAHRALNQLLIHVYVYTSNTYVHIVVLSGKSVDSVVATKLHHIIR